MYEYCLIIIVYKYMIGKCLCILGGLVVFLRFLWSCLFFGFDMVVVVIICYFFEDL